MPHLGHMITCCEAPFTGFTPSGMASTGAADAVMSSTANRARWERSLFIRQVPFLRQDAAGAIDEGWLPELWQIPNCVSEPTRGPAHIPVTARQSCPYELGLGRAGR